jgi:hypothetical protein
LAVEWGRARRHASLRQVPPLETSIHARRILVHMGLIGCAVLGPWAGRDAIMSGYIGYPIPLIPLPVDWRPTRASAEHELKIIRQFSRNPWHQHQRITVGWFVKGLICPPATVLRSSCPRRSWPSRSEWTCIGAGRNGSARRPRGLGHADLPVAWRVDRCNAPCSWPSRWRRWRSGSSTPRPTLFGATSWLLAAGGAHFSWREWASGAGAAPCDGGVLAAATLVLMFLDGAMPPRDRPGIYRLPRCRSKPF